MYSGLSVFDLDHTLLTANSSYLFGLFLYRQRFCSRWKFFYALWFYLRHKFFGLSLNHVHQKIFFNVLKGRSLQEVDRYVKFFLDRELSKLIYLPVMQRLQKAKKNGEYTLLLSSSPDFVVAPIAAYLGVSGWQACMYEIDEKGNFDCISTIVDGPYKAQYVAELAQRLGIPMTAITAYSDSYLDLPVLKIAGKAIGVVPDSCLYKTCLKNGWEIIQ